MKKDYESNITLIKKSNRDKENHKEKGKEKEKSQANFTYIRDANILNK